MIIQIFATYCRAAEFALQMQQEMFRLWLSPWCSAVAPAAGGRRTEPAQAAPERRPETGPEVRNDRREALDTPSGSRVWTHEAARRSPEAAVIHRQNGHGEALAAAPAARIGEDTRIQLREEQLHVRKHLMAAGEVRVRKEVRTEYRTIEVPVSREEIVIERLAPAEAPVTAADFAPGEVIRIPLMREQVVVEKRPVVREEVRVGKRVVRETERVGGEVRKEEVRIEREGDVEIHDRCTVQGAT